jgi:hypothetical protein
MNIKSPFYVVNNFISPLTCEEIVDVVNFITPDTDKDGREVKTSKTCERAESIIFDRLRTILPDVQSYYQLHYKGTEEIVFEMLPQGGKCVVNVENSAFLRGKWVRTKARDLTAVLFLCDY